ncbi:hypothetical protein [Paenibacillus sp. FSL R5-0928]|uniref:hypothetical protein n=1 Tax=Paenibacillus sp. FSL R5-0928 TaxID=2921667 RepID=UPI0030DCBE4E
MAQQTMYPAIANSPGTELSAALTAAATTIAVVDATKLPAAPNVFTIGTDESSETILYTGKSGNSLTGCTRGFDGTTPKAWAIGSKVARYYTAYDHEAFRKNLTDLSGVTSESTTDVILSAGQQILNATKNARLQGLKIQGRTLIDLLGGAGSGESLVGWTQNGTTATTLSSTQKRSGSTAFKFSPSAGAAYITKDFTTPLDASKYYVMAGWVFIESYVDGSLNLALRDVGTMTARYNMSINVSLLGQWQFVYFKIPTNNTLLGTGYRLTAGSTGSGTNVTYMDEIRLYAVSAADYAAIGTTITGEAIDRLLPYVPPGINGVDGLWVRRYGKNLLPPTPSLLGSIATPIGPYDLIFASSSANQVSRVVGEVIPNTVYTLSVKHNATIRVVGGDTAVNVVNSTTAQTVTFNSGANTTLYITLVCTAIGTFYFKDWQLEIGSTVSPFQPREDSLIAFSGVELHANPTDGSEPDILREVNGRYEVTKLWREMALDGTLPWGNASNYTGFKRVGITTAISDSTALTGSYFVSKYNGTPLVYANAWDAADKYSLIGPATKLFQVTIANSDSGWGDSYTPTSDEIKAYFNGWRMYTDGQPAATNVYSGTGTKAWAKKNDAGGIVEASGVFVVPLTSNDSLTGRYQLLYRLAAVTMETVQEDGSLSLLEGDNFIEVGSGYVSRERATPVWESTGNKYHLNNAGLIGNTLKYRADKILRIFRDSRQDDRWMVLDFVSAFGKQLATIPAADYDPSASYSVSYIKLDKSPVPSVSGFYAATEKAQLHDLTDAVIEISSAVSTLAAKKAEKDAGPWITPSTLLNGFTGNQLSYRKNGNYVEFKGFAFYNVIDAPGGTIIMNLPAGFRPLSFVNLPTTSWGDTGALSPSAIGVYVGIDGIVQLSVPSKRNVLFDGLRFPLD